MPVATQPRVAIIGSCVTRDVWNLPVFSDAERAAVFMLARTSFGSLFAPAYAGFKPPEEIPPGLSRFEIRMVEYDLLKTGLARLANFRPTHLIFDFIDERFPLARAGGAIATLSPDSQRLAFADRDPGDVALIPRGSPAAFELWRGGLAGIKRFVEAELPAARLILHDARCATRYVDEQGDIRELGSTWEFWPGRPESVEAQNELLGRYAAEFRQALPQAAYIRAPAELQLAAAGHRWGLAPFHYVDGYYGFIAAELDRLGCRQSAEPLAVPPGRAPPPRPGLWNTLRSGVTAWLNRQPARERELR
jgi:hypothetical protein